jgi:hypothetical protein
MCELTRIADGSLLNALADTDFDGPYDLVRGLMRAAAHNARHHRNTSPSARSNN